MQFLNVLKRKIIFKIKAMIITKLIIKTYFLYCVLSKDYKSHLIIFPNLISIITKHKV